MTEDELRERAFAELKRRGYRIFSWNRAPFPDYYELRMGKGDVYVEVKSPSLESILGVLK